MRDTVARLFILRNSIIPEVIITKVILPYTLYVNKYGDMFCTFSLSINCSDAISDHFLCRDSLESCLQYKRPTSHAYKLRNICATPCSEDIIIFFNTPHFLLLNNNSLRGYGRPQTASELKYLPLWRNDPAVMERAKCQMTRFTKHNRRYWSDIFRIHVVSEIDHPVTCGVCCTGWAGSVPQALR